jgi:CheY-like chemotaxis protein
MPFMGGMDSMEATELIQSYETHKCLTSTPIIALTAHASAYLHSIRVTSSTKWFL